MDLGEIGEWLKTGAGGGLCECGDEPSGSDATDLVLCGGNKMCSCPFPSSATHRG
jgi:hypothetical protein